MFLWYKQINNDQIYALESMMSYLAWNECVEVLFLHYLKKRSTFPLKCRLEWNMLPLRRFPAFSSRERQWRLCFCASLEFFFFGSISIQSSTSWIMIFYCKCPISSYFEICWLFKSRVHMEKATSPISFMK